MNSRTQVEAEYSPMRRKIAIFIAQITVDKAGNASRSICTGLTCRKASETEAAQAPLQITREDAQLLMDSLYRCGIRPSDEGSPGQLAATNRHLEDMRRLVFEPQPLPAVLEERQA